MPPAPLRIFVLIAAVQLASCDAASAPKACRTDVDAHALKEAEAYVERSEEAVVRARMMGPSPYIQNVRPPDFEPDPVAARAVSTLTHARFKLAQAMARCGGGAQAVTRP